MNQLRIQINILAGVFFLSTTYVVGQGCSDAGFCTMGAMKPDQTYNKRLNLQLRSAEINLYHGKTTLSPNVNVATLDFTFSLNSRNFVQVKVPYQTVEGNLGKTQGIGDLSLGYTRNMGTLMRGDVNLTIGSKIPTGHSDIKTAQDRFAAKNDLPMYYQISLGTFDLIAGASYIDRKWLVATGIQIPIIHINENEFKWGAWEEYPSRDYIEEYDRATHLKRGIDVMLRVERNWRWTNFNFNLGLLPIYRITRDQRLLNWDATGGYVKSKSTRGLALSLLGGAGYSFDTKNSIKLILGKKLTHRKNNPDGLTREHVASVSYVHRF